MNNKYNFRVFFAVIFSLVIVFTFPSCNNNYDSEAEPADTLSLEEQAEENIQSDNDNIYGYWSGGRFGKEELLVNENEVYYVYDKVLYYHGPYVFDDEGWLIFGNEYDIETYTFKMFPGGLGCNEEDLMTHDVSIKQLSWDFGSRQEKEAYDQRQQQQYNNSQQHNPNKNVTAFYCAQDVYRYLSEHRFKGYGSVISFSNGGMVMCANGNPLTNAMEILSFSDHKATLRYTSPFNPGSARIWVDCQKGTIRDNAGDVYYIN